jgi:uncharacterized protein YcsI (UPF0317 family)
LRDRLGFINQAFHYPFDLHHLTVAFPPRQLEVGSVTMIISRQPFKRGVDWKMQNLNDQQNRFADFDAMVPAPAPSVFETRSLSPREARLLFRTGEYAGYTSSFSAGYIQANLGILPREFALDFVTYCHRNAKTSPLIAIGNAGDPFLPTLGEDLDIRTDVPCYRVFRDGEVVEEPTDIKHLWREDLVAFVWGCGFSFEHALMEAGVYLRDAARGDNVALYETNIDTVPAGVFAGKLVVTMRPLAPADAIRATQVTSRFPSVHGAPIHIGAPEQIGITDLESPLFNLKPPQMRPDEIPVFWACGVTPRLALERARLPFCITHKPGSMVIADQRNTSLSIL